MKSTFDTLELIRKSVNPDDAKPITKTGTVTVASPLSVQWVGEADDAGAVWPKLDIYSPSVGDIVIAVQHGNTWLVVGSIGGVNTGIVASASGEIVITPSAANTPTPGTVTYPVGRFTSPPTVMLTASTTVPGTAVTGVGVSNNSTTGCTIYLTRTNTAATGVYWFASQTN